MHNDSCCHSFLVPCILHSHSVLGIVHCVEVLGFTLLLLFVDHDISFLGKFFLKSIVAVNILGITVINIGGNVIISSCDAVGLKFDKRKGYSLIKKKKKLGGSSKISKVG